MSWTEYNLVVLGPFKAKQNQPNPIENPPLPSQEFPGQTAGLTELLGLRMLYDIIYMSNIYPIWARKWTCANPGMY